MKPAQSDQLAPLLEGRPSCPSICPSLASSPSFGGASGFIPLKLFKSAKSPKKIAGGTGIIFKFNSDLLKQGVDLKFEFLNQWFYVWIMGSDEINLNLSLLWTVEWGLKEAFKSSSRSLEGYYALVYKLYMWIFNMVFKTIKLPMLRPEGAELAAGKATFSARCPSKCPSLRSKCMPLQDIFPSWSLCFQAKILFWDQGPNNFLNLIALLITVSHFPHFITHHNLRLLSVVNWGDRELSQWNLLMDSWSILESPRTRL